MRRRRVNQRSRCTRCRTVQQLPRLCRSCRPTNLQVCARAGGGRASEGFHHVPVLPRALRRGPVRARAGVGVRGLRRGRRARDVLPCRACNAPRR